MTQPSLAMSSSTSSDSLDGRYIAIRAWLLADAALVFVLVIVGGATRLTESGLSITEWRPATGTLPPMSEDAWQNEFDKYKTIPQYTQRNLGMMLTEFKTIYWWEWTHRFMARFVGIAFFVPFVFFLWRGWIRGPLAGRLAVIFGLGALQGAVGWWMVASGLADRTEVSQYRLATHLTLASLIFAALIATAVSIRRRREIRTSPVPARIRIGAQILLLLVFVQIYLGALVAGLRAGLLYNTWPLIDDAFIPDSARLWFETPLWRNLFENALTVQFNHRMMAYALWGLAVVHALDVVRSIRDGASLNGAITLAIAITIQAAIGILTLLNQVPISYALIHQAVAMIVLAIAVVHVSRCRNPV
jgi:cytochrome c oxidase assembly protein subunit 15